MKGKTVLFVCKGNSGRSQMAEAFFNHEKKSSMAISAGSEPDLAIHPSTVRIMKEVGIDLRGQKPKPLTLHSIRRAYRIIIMDERAMDSIPREYMGKVEEWDIGKLLGKSLANARRVRDRIKREVGRMREK